MTNFDVSIFEIDKTKNMVNLTAIAKHFNKDVNQWKRLPSTYAFLKAWKQENELCENHIVSLEGGAKSGAGTWAHREIALKFAQWISPSFEVFCIKKLDELFQRGTVSLLPTAPANDALTLAAGIQAAARLIAAKDTEIAAKDKEIAYLKTRVPQKALWTISEIGTEIGISGQRLNTELCRLGVQVYDTELECWVIAADYTSSGYVYYKNYKFKDAEGERKEVFQMKWTASGRAFIHKMLAKK